MKKILLLTFILISSVANSAEKCVKAAIVTKEQPLTGKNNQTLCTLNMKNKGVKSEIKILFLHKGCKKFEDGNSVNCLVTQVCNKGNDDLIDEGLPVLLTSESLKYICIGNDDHYLYGDVDKPGAKSYIKCPTKKITSISIKSSEGKEKVCDFSRGL